MAIRLQKGGAQQGDPYAVDAVSGGTLTSIGVENMLKTASAIMTPIPETACGVSG